MRKSLRPSYPVGDFKTARDWYIYYVYNDPDFIAECRKLDEVKDEGLIRKHYFRIARQFDISPYDVFFFQTRKIIYLEKNLNRKGALSFDPKTKKFTLAFDFSISRAEFLDFWSEFEGFRTAMVGKLKAKRKPPEHPQLVYAMHKALKKHTFPEIYSLYRDGKLPGYSGSRKQFWDAESLESYYYKYRPDK